MPFKRQKSNVSPHYHDTRTLLRKYRDVMWNLEVSDLDLQEEFKAEYGLSTDALFVDSEVNKGGNRLESYARALERSKKMMQIIDTAIDLMRRKHKKGEFYYWILYYAYLSPQQCENAGAILQLLETKGISISLRRCNRSMTDSSPFCSSVLPVNVTVTGTLNHSCTVSLMARSVWRFSSRLSPPCSSSIVRVFSFMVQSASLNVPFKLASSSRTRSKTEVTQLSCHA